MKLPKQEPKMSLFNFGFQQAKLAVWFQPLVSCLPGTGITFVAPLIRCDIFSLRYYAQIRGEPRRDLIKICGSLWMLRDALMWKRGMGILPFRSQELMKEEQRGRQPWHNITVCFLSSEPGGPRWSAVSIVSRTCKTKDHFFHQTPQFFANYSEIWAAPIYHNDATFVKTGTRDSDWCAHKDRNLTPLAAVFVSELGFRKATRPTRMEWRQGSKRRLTQGTVLKKAKIYPSTLSLPQWLLSLGKALGPWALF